MIRTQPKSPLLKNVAAGLAGKWQFMLLCGLLLVGLLIGTLISRDPSAERLSQMNTLMGGFATQRASQSFWDTLGYSIMSTLPLLIVTFLLGLCAAGALLIPILPLFRGLGLGFSLGYLYQTQGLKGIAFSVLLIILPAILSCLALLLACKESLVFSMTLCGQMLPNSKNLRLWPMFKKYAVRFLIFLAIVGVAAVIDTIFSAAFLRFFLTDGAI